MDVCAVVQNAGFAVFCGAVYTDDRSHSHVKKGPFGSTELHSMFVSRIKIHKNVTVYIYTHALSLSHTHTHSDSGVPTQMMLYSTDECAEVQQRSGGWTGRWRLWGWQRRSVVLEQRQQVIAAVVGQVRGAQVGQQLVRIGQLREKLGDIYREMEPILTIWYFRIWIQKQKQFKFKVKQERCCWHKGRSVSDHQQVVLQHGQLVC